MLTGNWCVLDIFMPSSTHHLLEQLIIQSRSSPVQRHHCNLSVLFYSDILGCVTCEAQRSECAESCILLKAVRDSSDDGCIEHGVGAKGCYWYKRV